MNERQAKKSNLAKRPKNRDSQLDLFQDAPTFNNPENSSPSSKDNHLNKPDSNDAKNGTGSESAEKRKQLVKY